MLDTNVLLAGLATHGLCEALLLLCLRDHCVVCSDHILDELAEHYRLKFKATSEQIDIVLATLRAHTQIVEPVDVPGEVFEDVDDLPVLGTAIAGQAVCLVTGDKKLIDLGRYHNVAIMSPRAFYDRIRRE